MHAFLKESPDTPYGLKVSEETFAEFNKFCSVPLYALKGLYDHI